MKKWYESLWKIVLIRAIPKLENLSDRETIPSKAGMKKHFIVIG